MSISKAYNKWAAIYDTNDNKTRDLEKAAALSTLANYSYQNVLEIGCGTGKNTTWLMEKAESITGIDFSEEMLRKAQEKIHSEKVHFQQGDLTLPWEVEDGSFDLISCSLTLEHIEDLEFIFAQAFSKLQPKGIFYLCEYHSFKQYAGGVARFETDKGIEKVGAFVHHVTDYSGAAVRHGFSLLEINEWFDNGNRKGIPRLISFVFEKG